MKESMPSADWLVRGNLYGEKASLRLKRQVEDVTLERY